MHTQHWHRGRLTHKQLLSVAMTRKRGTHKEGHSLSTEFLEWRKKQQPFRHCKTSVPSDPELLPCRVPCSLQLKRGLHTIAQSTYPALLCSLLFSYLLFPCVRSYALVYPLDHHYRNLLWCWCWCHSLPEEDEACGREININGSQSTPPTATSSIAWSVQDEDEVRYHGLCTPKQGGNPKQKPQRAGNTFPFPNPKTRLLRVAVELWCGMRHHIPVNRYRSHR